VIAFQQHLIASARAHHLLPKRFEARSITVTRAQEPNGECEYAHRREELPG
jgi:hypothetical protein